MIQMERQTGSQIRAGFDPRARIYRDPFNEYLVFLLSATGAGVLVPMVLLLAGVIAGRFGIGIFLAATIALELLLIFGIGRPQMKPHERAGWALLWSASAVVLGVCFYYLVFDSLL